MSGIKQCSVDPPSCVCCSSAITLHGVRRGMEHLKPPEPLLSGAATNKAEAWRRWKMSWDLYKVASGLDQEEEKIQVATLLHVLGKEYVEIFSNFFWTSGGDRNKIEAVEEKFNDHCASWTSRYFNRFLFIERKQHEGEIVDKFCSDLKTLAKNCDLGDKEDSWIASVFLLGLKDPHSKARKADGERTDFRENVTSCSYSRNKQTAHEELKRREQPC